MNDANPTLNLPRPGIRRVARGTGAAATTAKPRRSESLYACPSRPFGFGRPAGTVRPAGDFSTRTGRRLDRPEGTTMKTLERFIRSLSRFVFGLGVGLALTSAYVIVSSGSALTGRAPSARDVVRLDPIVVTMSRQRFDALYAEANPPAPVARAHAYGRGPQAV